MPRGPKRAPARNRVPKSNGAPKTAKSARLLTNLAGRGICQSCTNPQKAGLTFQSHSHVPTFTPLVSLCSLKLNLMQAYAVCKLPCKIAFYKVELLAQFFRMWPLNYDNLSFALHWKLEQMTHASRQTNFCDL